MYAINASKAIFSLYVCTFIILDVSIHRRRPFSVVQSAVKTSTARRKYCRGAYSLA